MKILHSYALHLAWLAILHLTQPEGPQLSDFNLEHVEAAEDLLFKWYRATKGIRKTEPASDAHFAIGEAHAALIELRWRLSGYWSKPLKKKRVEKFQKIMPILPKMAAWTAQEYERYEYC